MNKVFLGFSVKQWIALSLIVTVGAYSMNYVFEKTASIVAKAVAPADGTTVTETTPPTA